MDPETQTLEAPSTDTQSTESDFSRDSAEDFAALDRMIAQDEAADAALRGEKPDANATTPARGPDGKFLSAKEADRAGQATATEQGKPKEGQEVPADKDNKQDSSGTPPAELSRYQKAREREAKAWKQINADKLELEAERAKLAAEREQLTQARQQPAQQQPAQQAQLAESHYTARDYLAAARAFEARGEFDLADSAREAAAEKLEGQANGNGTPAAPTATGPAGQAEAWAKAKADFPQVIDPKHPANAEMIAFIKAHPAVLDYAQGPYLAASLVVAQQAAKRVPDLEKEAGRVPELVKQVETLSAKVKELQALTALPGSGSPTSRGDLRGTTDFRSMTTKQMEETLDREFKELTAA